MFLDIISALVDCFFPPHCYCCQEPSGEAELDILCDRCRAELERTLIRPPLCNICGRPFAAGPDPDNLTCLNCRIKAPHFHIARSVFPYRGPAGAVVKAFKYADQYYLGPILLRKAINEGWLPGEIADCDAIVPVPLHRRQRLRRGYNQAELLAEEISKHISRPMIPHLISRIRPTASQTKLAVGQRAGNVRGAFSVKDRDIVRSILLVDDVYTTGATANECAKELKRAGCRSIAVLTLVRAMI